MLCSAAATLESKKMVVEVPNPSSTTNDYGQGFTEKYSEETENGHTSNIRQETSPNGIKDGTESEQNGTTNNAEQYGMKDGTNWRIEVGQNEEERNGNPRVLQRIETVPDIKRDCSGITTQYIATGIDRYECLACHSAVAELAQDRVNKELPAVTHPLDSWLPRFATPVNLGAFASGVCVAWSSSSLSHAAGSHFEISGDARNGSTHHPGFTMSEYEVSWAASLLCLGALFGAVPAGLISEYFGRMKTLLYLALPLVVSWILVAASPNVYGLYLGRFVGGVAVGAFSVGIPPYVEDIAEKQVLPTLANIFHLHFTCGVLFGYIIGIIGNYTWFYFINASIPVAFFIASSFLPESPAYLMSQSKYIEAKAALRYYRGVDDNIGSEIQILKDYIRNYSKNKVTFKELFGTRATVKALVVSFGLVVFQQLSGIYPVLFYAENIFGTFPASLNPPLAAIVLGFFLVSSTYFSSVLLRNIRRRVLLMISLTSMAVTLGFLAIYYHLQVSHMMSNNNWIPLCSLCLYVSLYAAGIGPIPWLMVREIFPPNVRRRATAITAGFHWFLAFGVTKLYQNLVGKVGPGWTLWHFAVTCLIGTIFVYFFVPETKGRTLEDIQDEFDGVQKKHTHMIQVECCS